MQRPHSRNEADPLPAAARSPGSASHLIDSGENFQELNQRAPHLLSLCQKWETELLPRGHPPHRNVCALQ